jgi:hypothetical protein
MITIALIHPVSSYSTCRSLGVVYVCITYYPFFVGSNNCEPHSFEEVAWLRHLLRFRDVVDLERHALQWHHLRLVYKLVAHREQNKEGLLKGVC